MCIILHFLFADLSDVRMSCTFHLLLPSFFGYRYYKHAWDVHLDVPILALSLLFIQFIPWCLLSAQRCALRPYVSWGRKRMLKTKHITVLHPRRSQCPNSYVETTKGSSYPIHTNLDVEHRPNPRPAITLWTHHPSSTFIPAIHTSSLWRTLCHSNRILVPRSSPTG